MAGERVAVEVEPGVHLQCYVDDYLFPWDGAIPVIASHGQSRNANFWVRCVPMLARSHRIYRVDWRGFGDSTKPGYDYRHDFERAAMDALAIADRFRLKEFHWLGEASGGIIGFYVAAAAPGRVKSMVLCDTPARLLERQVEKYALGHGTAGAAIRRMGTQQWASETVRQRLDVDAAPSELVEWYSAEMGRTPTHITAAVQEAIEAIDLTQMVSTLDVPVLLLTGERRPLAHIEQQAATAAALPQGKLKVLPGCGPGLMVLAPDACAGEALAFWRRLANGESSGPTSGTT